MTGRDKETRPAINIFRRQSSSKVAEPPADAQSSPIHSVSSTSHRSNVNSQGRESVKDIFRRSRSRLLSMLRLRGSRGVRSCDNIQQTNADGSTEQNVKPAEKPIVQRTAQKVSIPNPPEIGQHSGMTRDTLAVLPASPLPGNQNNIRVKQDLGAECSLNLKLATGGNRAALLQVRRSHSTPGLTHRLSHKISMTFGHPTVVHRANLRRRPSICTFYPNPSRLNLSGLQRLGDSAHDDSDPPTLNLSGSSTSRVTQSTNPTSEGSPILPPLLKHLSLNLIDRERLIAAPGLESSENNSYFYPGSPHPTTPSIITVEATASAKIFFETYFNTIFSGDSPRVRRRRELEEKLHSLSLSSEERFKIREAWHRQESEYLRQGRVMKTRSNCVQRGESISIAGYELVKVLGRGSFGVVRLVKETSAALEPGAPTETARSTPRGDVSQLKSNTMDALKSAMESTRSRRKDTGKTRKDVFAMKVIRKSEMLRNCQEGHLRAERDFLVASQKSRWIVPLIASFQDEQNLYLVMDYMLGGDFLSLLMRKNILSEEVTKWYIGEMVLCVEEAHRLRWIHRDVKPDNFLISASGHLKISDFGLAFDGHWSHDQSYFDNHRLSLLSKLGIHIEGDSKDRKAADAARQQAEESHTPQNREIVPQTREPSPNEDILRWRNRKERRKLARSVVGTSQYMAPEVVQGRPYDGRCDWWSIGIILYECLFGFTPFAATTREETKKKIEDHHNSLFFPVDKPSDRLVSAEAIDLIGQILQAKEHRLCSRKYMLNDYVHSKRIPGELLNRPADKEHKNYQGYYVYPDDASDIKDHPFFRNILWDEMHFRKPPFIPKVKRWDDTKYFDDDGPDVLSDTSSELPLPNEGAMAKDMLLNKDVDPRIKSPKSQVTPAKSGNKELVQNVQAKSKSQRKKEKRRPRDKILRDEEVGKVALNMRKHGAFLGYTYRRPKDVLAMLENERGRSLVTREDR